MTKTPSDEAGSEPVRLFLWELESMPLRDWGLPTALVVGKTWKSNLRYMTTDAEPEWWSTTIRASNRSGYVEIQPKKVELKHGPMPPDWWAESELWRLGNEIAELDYAKDRRGTFDCGTWFRSFMKVMQRLQSIGVGSPDWGNMRGWRDERMLEKERT